MPAYGPSTALVVVDVQNDFADPNGSLFVTGGTESIGFVNEQLALASDAGATIVYTQDWHPADTPHFAKDGGIWPVHCVGGEWGSELHPDLDVVPNAIRIRKGTAGEDGYSGFTVRDPVSAETASTGLASALRALDIDSVVVVGLALDYCVKETALDAERGGFATTVLADGTRAVNLSPGDGTRAAAELAAAGVVIV